MPVTKSAKRALQVAKRRHTENLIIKNNYKKALKAARKSVEDGGKNVAELFGKAQQALDIAAKSNTIHRNKAARLKSRLNKFLTKDAAPAASAPAKKAAAKATPKKAAGKTTAKKSK